MHLWPRPPSSHAEVGLRCLQLLDPVAGKQQCSNKAESPAE